MTTLLKLHTARIWQSSSGAGTSKRLRNSVIFDEVDEKGKIIRKHELSKVSASALEFEIEGTNGGMISRGIGGAITGNPADLIVLDDPYKNRQEADSPIYQKFVIDEWLNTIQTRASAKCKYIVVHTRWNEDDLIGYLLQTEPDKWFEIPLSRHSRG